MTVSSRSAVHIYAFGMCYASVCAPVECSLEEVTAEVNRLQPTGLRHGWEHSPEPFKDGSPNPKPCEEDAQRQHFLFVC